MPDTTVTLLHPVFGQFMDDREKYIPMAEDYALVDALIQALQRFYDLEKDRQAEILKVVISRVAC